MVTPLVENMLHWSFGEVCVKELHHPTCLSLSCHAEGDLGSKGRKVRVYLLKATWLLLQKNTQRPQTHHCKASHRGHGLKLKQRFFSLYTSLLQLSASGPTCHHGRFRFINSGCWNLYNPEAPRCCIDTLCPCSKRKILEDLICFHFLLYYFLTSLPSLFVRTTYRVTNFCPQRDH